MAPAGVDATSPDGLTLETALEEQLGLELVSRRVPADALIVDNAELPAED